MFFIENKSKITYLQFSNLKHFKELNHFVSTRKGGYSQAPYNNLNLGLKVNDADDSVIENRRAIADAVGIEIGKFVIPSQCHSNNICIVDESNLGMGVYEKDSAIDNTDALITNKRDICLIVFAADCVPILIYDPVKKVIASAHAGWKGTVNRIVRNVISTMSESFGTEPKDIYAGIGPSIGPCCYKIGEEVINYTKNSFEDYSLLLITSLNNDVFLDLWQANKIILEEMGVPEKNIEISELCTSCYDDMFFSHRKSGGLTGRFGAGIMLK